MARKSFNQIVSDMRTYIRSKDSSIDTEVGSVMRDVSIDAPANEIQGIYVENERVSFLHSFFYYDNMTEDELDQLAYNYGLTRNLAVASTGTVWFRRSTPLDDDIVILQGTTVSTTKSAEEDAKDFITTEEKTMLLANASSYFNSDTGYYEIEVSIEAEVSGVDGDVSANAINVITSSVTGIDNCINKVATTGGQDRESNESFSNRGLLALSGNNVGTESGYLSTVLANTYVLDALLVGPGDDLMTRDAGLGGKVDIYISANITNANTYTSVTDTYTYSDLSGGDGATSASNDHIFDNQPVRAIASVVGSSSGTFTPGVDYELQLTETTSTLYGSTQAIDKMHWLLDSPQEGETITITYTYYSLMEELELLVEDNRNVTADVLLKLAIEISINATVVVYADATITEEGEETFRNSVESAISTFLTSNTLGRQIQQSDIVAAIYAVDGVDRVGLPFIALNTPDKTGYETGVNDEIPLTSREYGTAGTIDVNVVRVS
jgi:uncharacterized phage protein gp47/JayE